MKYWIINNETMFVMGPVTLSTLDGYEAVAEQAHALGYRLEEVKE